MVEGMKSSQKRARKYKAKIKGQVLPGQKPGFARAVQGQVQTEINIKNILTQHGVMVGLIHFYMDFGKKVMQLKQKFSGQTMKDEVEALQRHWTLRGLDVAVLDAIKGWASVTGLPFRLDHSLLDGPDVLS